MKVLSLPYRGCAGALGADPHENADVRAWFWAAPTKHMRTKDTQKLAAKRAYSYSESFRARRRSEDARVDNAPCAGLRMRRRPNLLERSFDAAGVHPLPSPRRRDAFGALRSTGRRARHTPHDCRTARATTHPPALPRALDGVGALLTAAHAPTMRRLHHTPKQMAVERDAAMGDGEKLPWGARGRAPEGTPSRAVRRERSMAGRPGRLVATQRRVSRAPALRRCRCRMSVGQEGYRLLKGWWTPGVARGGNAGEPAAGQAAPATLTAAALAGGGVRRCGASDSQRQQL